MNKKYKYAFFILAIVGIVVLAGFYLHSANIAILNPKGPIAQKERQLIIIASLMMLIVVIPVFTLTFGIAWKYRASNTKAKYSPEWDHSRLFETIWWTVPSLLILILAVITWKGSHELDPFKPLNSNTKPITIQVVALQWKWLFIYPEQNIATVNFFQFPEQTPVNFQITADAPMNSFWIPQLGGQIYAMSGMSTQLHLMANEAGSYRGSSANISGLGFAGMTFVAKSSSQADFNNWVLAVKHSPSNLTLDQYNKLAAPTQDNPPAYYASKEANLYDKIVMKYMAPDQMTNTGNNIPMMYMPGMSGMGMQ